MIVAFNIYNIKFRSVKVSTTKLPEGFEPKKMPEEKENGNLEKFADTIGQNGLFMGIDAVDKREVNGVYDKKLCIVCFEEEVNVLYKPCDHGGICKICALENLQIREVCPVCRAKVDYIVIYQEGEDGRLYQVGQYPETFEITS